MARKMEGGNKEFVKSDKWLTISDIRKRTMLEALEKTLGIVTQALQLTGQHISRETHYEWMRSDAEYKKYVDSIEDMVLDLGESALYKNVQEGKEMSVKFLLSCKARKRGYAEKLELTGKDGGPIEFADVSKMTDEQIDEYLKAKLASKA